MAGWDRGSCVPVRSWDPRTWNRALSRPLNVPAESQPGFTAKHKWRSRQVLQGPAPSGAGADILAPVGVDVEGPGGSVDHLLADHHALDSLQTGKVEHGIEEDSLHDR